MLSESNRILIEQLNEMTGIPFTVETDKLSDSELKERLKSLLDNYSAYQNSSSRNTIFLHYLKGQLSAEEARNRLHPYHIDKDVYYNLLLLHFDKIYTEDDSVISILSEFLDQMVTEFLCVSDTELVIVHLSDHKSSQEDLMDFARQIEDTLSSEAMMPVRISMDESTSDFESLQTTYQNLFLAMKIGMTFFSSRRIYDYHKLGLGKLISNLPPEACKTYLEETLPGIDFSAIDSETRNTINTFLESGLNIAETARILYLHRNTLVYRLDKFKKQTGLDLRKFDDAISCKIGMLLSEYLDSQN